MHSLYWWKRWEKYMWWELWNIWIKVTVSVSIFLLFINLIPGKLNILFSMLQSDDETWRHKTRVHPCTIDLGAPSVESFMMTITINQNFWHATTHLVLVVLRYSLRNITQVLSNVPYAAVIRNFLRMGLWGYRETTTSTRWWKLQGRTSSNEKIIVKHTRIKNLFSVRRAS